MKFAMSVFLCVLGINVHSAFAFNPTQASNLSNEHISLSFSKDNFSCIRVRDVKAGHDFIHPRKKSAGLWLLEFRGLNGGNLKIDNTVRCQKSARFSKDGRELILKWDNINNFSGEADCLAVTVHISLPKGEDKSYWRINVDNKSRKFSLVAVQFPRLVGMPAKEQLTVAVPRGRWGYIEHNIPAFTGEYPSYQWPMQFLSMHDTKSGLYLGYEDPRNFIKSFRLVSGGEFHFRVLAEDITKPGNDFVSPGPVAIGVCGKNWWQAAKMYRRWALKQVWTSEGPLVQRKSTPEFCKNIGLWFRYIWHESPEEAIRKLRQAKEFFGVPIAVHCYYWLKFKHDTHYPLYFPAKKGFKNFVDTLVSEDVVVMPYINARLADMTKDTFKECLPSAAKNMDGKPYAEKYGSGVKLAVMCPYTEFWQDTMVKLCDKLVKEYHVTGIYLDQIAAAIPAPCYDPNHGHPLGGGSWWVDGYRKMLRKIRKTVGPNVILATENNAEPYMNGVDCFLNWSPRLVDEIPMLTAVYSGYSIYFGTKPRCDPDDTLQPFAMHFGRDFIWGSQLGWMELCLFDFDKPSKRNDYLRQLVRLRHASLKYVIFGELLGEIKPLNDVGTVTGKWYRKEWYHSPFEAKLPAVMAALWKGSDNTLGLFFVNLSDQSQKFKYNLDTRAFGDIAGEGNCLQLTDIKKEGNTSCGFSKSLNLHRTETLEPWQARVIEVKRVKSQQK